MNHYVIYETINVVNNKKYRGAHSTSNLNDEYLGSGKLLKLAVEKYGKENFKRTILFTAFSSEDMYEIEKEFVNEEWVSDKSTYNLKVGGFGGWDHIDTNGENNGMYGKRGVLNHKFGKKESEETIKRKRLSRLGQIHSPETIQKFCKNNAGNGNPMYGKCGDKNPMYGTKNEKHSKRMSGKGNPAYGKIWIHSCEKQINKRINKQEPIPDGWHKGRLKNGKESKRIST